MPTPANGGGGGGWSQYTGYNSTRTVVYRLLTNRPLLVSPLPLAYRPGLTEQCTHSMHLPHALAACTHSMHSKHALTACTHSMHS